MKQQEIVRAAHMDKVRKVLNDEIQQSKDFRNNLKAYEWAHRFMNRPD
jgi:hypothetical protein